MLSVCGRKKLLYSDLCSAVRAITVLGKLIIAPGGTSISEEYKRFLLNCSHLTFSLLINFFIFVASESRMKTLKPETTLGELTAVFSFVLSADFDV